MATVVAKILVSFHNGSDGLLLVSELTTKERILL